MITHKYHSNGKLLLTGEYLVLNGASALAVPLKYGQTLEVAPFRNSKKLSWKAYVKNKLWFEATFDHELKIVETTIREVAQRLQDILRIALQIKGLTAEAISGNQVSTYLEFDNVWGFGSSSTLLSNIGYWMDVDPYRLVAETSNGSGYDVAAARSEKPVIYSLKNNKPVVDSIDFNPSFSNHLFFVYSGNKQRSDESVKRFLNIPVPEQAIRSISEYTQQAIKATSLESFINIIKAHNDVISGILGHQPPGKTLFNDFEGVIKPLGAWGGDFMLVASIKGEAYVKHYFSNKACAPVFCYNNLIK